MKYYWLWLMGTIVLLSVTSGFAQEEREGEPNATAITEDTLQLERGTIGVNEPGVDAPDTVVIQSMADQHAPRRAALYSAVLPGLGQAYNGKYWKIPIIYGGFITMGYFIILQDDQYRFYLRARNSIRNEGVNLLEEFPNSRFQEQDQLTRAIDNARRDRDFMIILTAGLYALNIMDAIVDAHLIEFDINPELSMDLKPMAGSALAYSNHLTPTLPAYGFSFTISLN